MTSPPLAQVVVDKPIVVVAAGWGNGEQKASVCGRRMGTGLPFFREMRKKILHDGVFHFSSKWLPGNKKPSGCFIILVFGQTRITITFRQKMAITTNRQYHGVYAYKIGDITLKMKNTN
jgi:hypothetical protein